MSICTSAITSSSPSLARPGCGKTTFLRMLLGVESPDRGQFLIDGAPLPPEPGPDRGIVFQRYSLFPHLTVLDNLLLGLESARMPVSSGACSARAAAGRSRRRSSCLRPSV